MDVPLLKCALLGRMKGTGKKKKIQPHGHLFSQGDSKLLNRSQTFLGSYHILGTVPDSMAKPSDIIHGHALKELVIAQNMSLPGSLEPSQFSSSVDPQMTLVSPFKSLS